MNGSRSAQVDAGERAAHREALALEALGAVVTWCAIRDSNPEPAD
jgi:hypothetical protein